MTVMRATSQRAANSSRANNTKNRQNKAVDTQTELLTKGNLTDCPSLSIDSYHPGISSLPLQGGKGSLDNIEAEREPTNLSTRVRARVKSHILITEGLMDFLAATGRRLL
jgi:hypothetical protein